jgi:hypothetical protein
MKMATIVDSIRTKARQYSARAGVSGLGVREDIARKVRGRSMDGLSMRSKAADIIEGRRKMGLWRRVKRTGNNLRAVGFRRTFEMGLEGEKPIRSWFQGVRTKYGGTGRVKIEDSSTGGDMSREYRVPVGSRNQYLDDTKIRNIQS